MKKELPLRQAACREQVVGLSKSKGKAFGGLALPLLIALLPTGVAAQTPSPIRVLVNGQPVTFSGMGPQQIQGRVLVPVRGVLEKLGATVAFDSRANTVIASSPNVDIQLKIGSRNAIVNGRDVSLDVPAQSFADHTFVPLRFIGEALGAKLGWNGQTRTVFITTDGSNPTGGANTPAPPQPAPASGPVPSINSFRSDAKGYLRAGEVLHVTMEGTPGGQAAFRIPGLAEDVALRETEPGRYTGTWLVPDAKPVQLKEASLIGSLRIGKREAPLLQASETVSVDAIPPTIRDRAPEADSRVTNPRPNISAALADQGSGINEKSVRVLLNNKDVTGDAVVTRDFVTYRPADRLPAGVQTVQIVAQDNAGNKTQSVWKFTIDEAATAGIKTVKHNAGKTLEPGDTLHVDLTGTPGGKAAFTLGSIKDVPMNEDTAGHYAADYTIRKGDDVNAARLTGRLITPDGERYVKEEERAVTVSTGKPIDPFITYPGPNDTPASPLVVKGKGTPNTKVHVRIDYQNKVFGVVALKGTAADVTVDVDKNGSWQTEPVNLRSLLPNRNTDVTVTATGVNAANESSASTQLKFRLR